MIYGQQQYYRDEIKAWMRLINFYKAELRELQKQLSIVLNFPLVSLPNAKTAQTLIDQLKIQERRFDHIHQALDHEMRGVEHSIDKSIDFAINATAKNYRNRMKSYEIAFIEAKYECSVFLSGFFLPVQLVAK